MTTQIAKALALLPELERLYKSATTWHRLEEIGAGQLEVLIDALKEMRDGAYVLVPREPTEAIIEAWEKSKPYDGDYTDEKCAAACWKDMVAAALAALAKETP